MPVEGPPNTPLACTLPRPSLKASSRWLHLRLSAYLLQRDRNSSLLPLGWGGGERRKRRGQVGGVLGQVGGVLGGMA